MTNRRETIAALSQQGSYRNSRVISLGAAAYTMREVLLAAPLIAALNVYLIGGTGEGKTQLSNNLAEFFGEQHCYMEGRPDFEPSELLKQLNLDLKRAKTDKDLVELTENVRKALYYVDELNRCPPIIQNYFFNFFDGKLIHRGKPYKMGVDGYAVGYATGNIGDGAYVGIEDSDRALKDRMHIILKLDDPDYCTTEEDDWHIFGASKNPRAKLQEGREDITSRIISLHKEFDQREVPVILQALGMYFHKGLDYLDNTKRHSKRAVDQIWPNVKDIRTDTDENKVMPFSKRAILATIGLTEALHMIAEAKGSEVKGSEVKDSVELYLDALRLTVPYSGVLSPHFVHNEHGGDAYAAFDTLMTSWRADITDKKKDLETAIAYALCGEQEETVLDRICPPGAMGRWVPVRRAIESQAKNPTMEAETLIALKEAYKKSNNQP